jgi:thymidylate kinase
MGIYMKINKIIAVEGLDKTGKSTFCDRFEMIFDNMQGINSQEIFRYSFPNAVSPIGKKIRDELNSSTPNPDIVNTPNFLSEMSHFWMEELFNNTQELKDTASSKEHHIVNTNTIINKNYIFDRYFISTLAYQAFYENSRTDLEFIKTAINNNKFLKLPTDIILLDLPNDKIIERTLADQASGDNDANDTIDEEILNKRRDAFKNAINFFKGSGVNIHWFEDVSQYTTDDLVKVLMGKIFG